MLLRLRVIFTVISAVFLAAVFPVGIFLDWPWAVACALCAGLFFVLMWVCKKKQEILSKSKRKTNELGFFIFKAANQTDSRWHNH